MCGYKHIGAMSDTNNSGSPDRPDSDYEIDDCPVLPGDVDVEAIQRIIRSEAPVKDPVGTIDEARTCLEPQNIGLPTCFCESPAM